MNIREILEGYGRCIYCGRAISRPKRTTVTTIVTYWESNPFKTERLKHSFHPKCWLVMQQEKLRRL